MAYDRNAAIKKHREFIELQNRYLRKRYFRKILPITLIIMVTVFAFYSYLGHFRQEETTIIVFACLTAFVLLKLYPFRSNWLLYSTLYYEIEGSRDAQGRHRCISCGGRGIWRQGQYKSSAVYCSCSKCNFDLWRE